ncbi:hypothetical protein KQX54_016455 [Cotesia glomerata]|uniref:Uncharacterized protein n=1 Tax=Cotesia glomerata TaxID=32391 RepID=A0AAV7HXI1_COTGL|nr:hypothetical protein KQX54_016455 [Cotesia glomerata]
MTKWDIEKRQEPCRRWDGSRKEEEKKGHFHGLLKTHSVVGPLGAFHLPLGKRFLVAETSLRVSELYSWKSLIRSWVSLGGVVLEKPKRPLSLYF